MLRRIAQTHKLHTRSHVFWANTLISLRGMTFSDVKTDVLLTQNSICSPHTVRTAAFNPSFLDEEWHVFSAAFNPTAEKTCHSSSRNFVRPAASKLLKSTSTGTCNTSCFQKQLALIAFSVGVCAKRFSGMWVASRLLRRNCY